MRRDEAIQATLNKMIAANNAAAQQYGSGTMMTGSGINGALSWPDGTKGLAQTGVMVLINQGRDMTTGAPNGGATTGVFFKPFCATDLNAKPKL